MVSSSLNRLLIAHFERARSPSLEIDQVYSIVAHSAFPAYVVHAHPAEHYYKAIFVENR